MDMSSVLTAAVLIVCLGGVWSDGVNNFVDGPPAEVAKDLPSSYTSSNVGPSFHPMESSSSPSSKPSISHSIEHSTSHSVKPSMSHSIEPSTSHGMESSSSHAVESASSHAVESSSSHAVESSSSHAVESSSSHAVESSSSHAMESSSSHAMESSSSHAMESSSSHAMKSSSSHAVESSSSHAVESSTSHSIEPSTSHSIEPSTSQGMESSTPHSMVLSSSHAMGSSTSHSIEPSTSQSVEPSTSHAMESSSPHSVEPSTSQSLEPSTSFAVSTSDAPMSSMSASLMTSSAVKNETVKTSAVASTSSLSPATSSVLPIHSSSSSKLAPSSSSHAATSSAVPTLKPTTVPPPDTVTLELKDKNKKICIEVVAKIDFEVNYMTTGKGKEKKEVEVHLAKGGTVTGNCLKPNHTSASISVKFSKYYTFGVEFSVEKGNNWKTANISFMATLKGNPAFHNASADSLTGHLPASSSSDAENLKANNKSYQCDSERDVKLTNGITVKFLKVRMQPFTLNNSTFADPEVCMADNGSNKANSIVPIAVGCALAGLIIIVLIAYLIGRRRSHRGYQQV